MNFDDPHTNIERLNKLKCLLDGIIALDEQVKSNPTLSKDIITQRVEALSTLAAECGPCMNALQQGYYAQLVTHS